VPGCEAVALPQITPKRSIAPGVLSLHGLVIQDAGVLYTGGSPPGNVNFWPEVVV